MVFEIFSKQNLNISSFIELFISTKSLHQLLVATLQNFSQNLHLASSHIQTPVTLRIADKTGNLYFPPPSSTCGLAITAGVYPLFSPICRCQLHTQQKYTSYSSSVHPAPDIAATCCSGRIPNACRYLMR